MSAPAWSASLMPRMWRMLLTMISLEVPDEILGLGDPLVGPGREDLDTQRDVVAVLLEQADDLLDVLPEIALLLLGEDGGVGGDAGRESARQRFLDLDQVRRVDEDLHHGPPLRGNGPLTAFTVLATSPPRPIRPDHARSGGLDVRGAAAERRLARRAAGCSGVGPGPRREAVGTTASAPRPPSRYPLRVDSGVADGQRAHPYRA